MTRVLLTGAAGFIGSHVAEGLVSRGDEVVGLDNFDAFYPRAVKEANVAALLRWPRFRLVEGDIRDAGAVALASGPDRAGGATAAAAPGRRASGAAVQSTAASTPPTISSM